MISNLRKCSICKKDSELINFKLYQKSKSGEYYYSAKCIECRKKYMNSWVRDKRISDPASAILSQTKAVDKNRSLRNDLTISVIRDLIKNPCSYCGTSSRKISLDRIDSLSGHTIVNVLPCCTRCNLIKRDMPQAAWLLLVPAIAHIEKSGLWGDWIPEAHYRERNAISVPNFGPKK